MTSVVIEARQAVDSAVAHLKSNEVLEALRPGLELRGFAVEKSGGKLPRPVLFGTREASSSRSKSMRSDLRMVSPSKSSPEAPSTTTEFS